MTVRVGHKSGSVVRRLYKLVGGAVRLCLGCCGPPVPPLTLLTSHFVQVRGQQYTLSGTVHDDTPFEPGLTLYSLLPLSTGVTVGPFTWLGDGSGNASYAGTVSINAAWTNQLWQAQATDGLSNTSNIIDFTLVNLAPTVMVTTVSYSGGFLTVSGTATDDVGVTDGLSTNGPGANSLTVTFSGGTGAFAPLNFGASTTVNALGNWSITTFTGGPAPATGDHVTAHIIDDFAISGTNTWTQP